MSDSTAATVTTTLRRHSSLTIQNSTQTLSLLSKSLLNLKLDALNNSPLSSYTSLRDMLPSTAAAVNSPTASSSGYEISIRNHLVKQAAWAYLQPMSASPTSSAAPHFLRRLCHRFSAFITFVNHHLSPGLSRVFHRILHLLCN
ncbi:hypothetical protein TanjilG_31110 [Lupinus angustifolius]|uniref:Uncharacterized protein n=1 Tax=Lupinus angustifolius TaxID=3871 RepID=A0A1J7HEU8_LUPAN|nr:PREDICTED: uncharacterized protein LOC109347228 [Lupinus angustifolius]OIW11342.1 hypothetical protein TanjilG_31110 [Lupinus angustifolius]